MLIYLIKRSHLPVLFAALASVLTGLCSVLPIAQINMVISADSTGPAQLVWKFAMAVVGALTFGVTSNMLLNGRVVSVAVSHPRAVRANGGKKA